MKCQVCCKRQAAQTVWDAALGMELHVCEKCKREFYTDTDWRKTEREAERRAHSAGPYEEAAGREI